MLVYIYDLFGKDIKEYNKVKRRFYYELKKILAGNPQINWKTKSMLVAPEKEEEKLDYFFKKYKEWIILYKFKPQSITPIT